MSPGPEVLRDLDRRIAAEPHRPLSDWFADWSPAAYARLFVTDLRAYPALASRLPAMPPVDVQRRWNGNEGERLMVGETADFAGIVRGAYERHTGRPLAEARVLDYGAGWGRLTRMFMQVVPEERVDAIDALERSVELYNSLGFRRPARLVEAKPRRPLDGAYDLAVLFSVLTHLPLDRIAAVMASLRPATRGLAVVTLRPADLWRRQGETGLLEEHEKRGYAHRPEGPGWGDTTMTVDFLAAMLPDWSVVEVEDTLRDWLQTIVYLR